jgi:hypothetical protein
VLAFEESDGLYYPQQDSTAAHYRHRHIEGYGFQFGKVSTVSAAVVGSCSPVSTGAIKVVQEGVNWISFYEDNSDSHITPNRGNQDARFTRFTHKGWKGSRIHT